MAAEIAHWVLENPLSPLSGIAMISAAEPDQRAPGHAWFVVEQAEMTYGEEGRKEGHPTRPLGASMVPQSSCSCLPRVPSLTLPDLLLRGANPAK